MNPVYLVDPITGSRGLVAQTGLPVTGSLNLSTDAVTMPALGSQWATVKFTCNAAGTATATAQYSIDGGTNWLSAPYAKRLSSVSANPTVQAISATTLTAGDTWEVPLPGNCTHFRLSAGAAGTATTVTLQGGLPYVPGMPVVGVLADVTEGSIGAGIAATVYDLSGWVSAKINFLTPTTQVWQIRPTDDTGAQPFANLVTTANTAQSLMLSQYAGSRASGTIAGGEYAAAAFAERRWQFTLPAGGTVSTGRIRIEARR